MRLVMSLDKLTGLASPSGWATEAARLLTNLGFILVNSDRPEVTGGANLLVALRAQPTLHHFDPEEVGYWVTEAGRGRPGRIDREGAVAPASPFAWGRITLVDRLGVKNQFLTFGGTLRVGRLDPTTLALGFASPAPILRGSGHSQAPDQLAVEVGAFFGRMMIPIDFDPEAEGLVARSTPLAIYAAFVQDTHDRYAHSEALREEHAALPGWSARETARLAAAAAEDWSAGAELRRRLGLVAS